MRQSPSSCSPTSRPCKTHARPLNPSFSSTLSSFNQILLVEQASIQLSSKQDPRAGNTLSELFCSFYFYLPPRRFTLTAIFASYSIGYAGTTPSTNAPSSLYSSDVSKMINAPVLHVNGDYYPEGMVSSIQEALCVRNADNPRKTKDVARAMDIAFLYRNYFRKVRTLNL